MHLRKVSTIIAGMTTNETLMTLIAAQTARSRDTERERILRIIANGKWRSKKQLLELIDGENRRPSTENR